MLNTFFNSLKLRYTYKTNKTIYILKKSIFGNLFKGNLYNNKSTKIIGLILSVLGTIITIFGSKFFIIGMAMLVMMYLANAEILVPSFNTLFSILFFAISCEAFAQSNLFEKKEYDYYATMLLKINTKKYTLVNYYWRMLLRIVSFIIAFVVLRPFIGIDIYLGILLAIYSVMLKTFINYLRVKEFQKNRKILRIITFPIAFLLLICALVFPICNINISIDVLNIILTISCTLGLLGIFGLALFNDYTKMNKKEFEAEYNPELNKINILKLNENKNNTFVDSQKNQEEKAHSKIKDYTIEKEDDENREKGIRYLNSLFWKRNSKKIIIREIITIIQVIIYGVICISFFKNNLALVGQLEQAFQFLITVSLLDGFYIGYLISSKYFELAFEKCDRAMLTFKSFRTKNNIKELFRIRTTSILKLTIFQLLLLAAVTVVTINLLGFEFLLIDKIIVFLDIILFGCLAIVTRGFIYYYFQPYCYNNILKIIKNSRPLLDIICIFLMIIPMIAIYINTGVGLLIILWTSVIIIGVELLMISKHAHKTFKLKE